MKLEDFKKAKCLVDEIEKLEDFIKSSGYQDWSEQGYNIKIYTNPCYDIVLSKEASKKVINIIKEEKNKLEKELEEL